MQPHRSAVRLAPAGVAGFTPLINKGFSQPGTLLSVVKFDFFGGSSLMGGKFDIGVDEIR